MALIKSSIEWHDLRIDPDDLPGDEEPIITTLESIDGTRMVWTDVFLKEDYNGEYHFCMYGSAADSRGNREKITVWYPVIAWAYPPDPYPC